VINLAQIVVPDLILIDSHLQDMYTLDVIRQIRCESNLIDVPIVALIDSDMKNLLNRYHSLENYCHLRKPFKLKQLTDSIQQLL
ncbi:MAG: response regulator, partial [Cyanobacteria bacterium P01_H01_bin.105]